jgi:MoCo/4Fe-4S cofactor protein with predicted Tat translocation signal
MNGREKNAEDLNGAASYARSESASGRRFWRSLKELAMTQEFNDFLHNEFPRDPAKEVNIVSRRDMLKLAGASAALAGLTACTKLPTQKIVPYVRPPEEFIPGKPLFYATAMPFGEAATGLLVESHMGRPTKVEGNPDHPGSLGATDVFAQAAVLTLYDPDRSQVLVHEGRIGSWGNFRAALNNVRDEQRSRKGSGLRILTETVTSPTLAHQLELLRAEFPLMKWHQYEPAGRDGAREGGRLAFGEYVNPIYRFGAADIVLALDADFLCSGPGHVRYARDFTDRRRVSDPGASMNRLYVVESTPSNTGAIADHRFPLRSGGIEGFARAVAKRLGVRLDAAGAAYFPPKIPAQWIAALVRDLETHRGTSLVLAGDQQPAAVHALAHAINQALNNAGQTVIYTQPIEANPIDQTQSLRELVSDMEAGLVEALVILGGNPVYTAPADLRFAEQLLKLPLRIHLSLYEDETSELSHWHVPEAHFLESWSDTRAYDGTVSIVQPLIAPLYDGKSAHELLATILGQPDRSAHDIVYDYWKAQHPSEDFEKFWETTLHDGLMRDTAFSPKQVSLRIERASEAKGGASHNQESSSSRSHAEGKLEIVFRPDPTIWDGRFANNGWLQELPKPQSQLTWDNAAMISPATAERLGLSNEQVVELLWEGRSVRAPVWILPGHADDSVTVHLGYGRKRAGRVGTGCGFNAYLLRSSGRPWFGAGLRIEKTGDQYRLAGTQHHHSIDTAGREKVEESRAAFQRDLVRVATLEEFNRNPNFAKDPVEKTYNAPSLYPGFEYEGYAWGMAIDLNSCTGCNACVLACQAENNIPVVGKTEVIAGREMHWIRIDTYYRGGPGNPEIYHEPVPCMHCENAPCEGVCPVGATVHSPEGLNEMVYNRCVGTRYCSNNCPYKVRRFNFRLYADWTTPSLMALRNPNVSVRSRGVMEKCTYCVQRINAAKIEAEKQDRAVRDGEIVTACQQACPVQAIVFGNVNDPNSRVSKLKAQSRNYGLLTDLNTRPRTSYLAKLRNPNPEIKE